MRLNKTAQYGLLLVAYITRSGTANLETVSETLKLSRPFLEQIGRKLRAAGILTTIRGPGGGYKLAKEATVGQVFDALEVSGFLNQEETQMFAFGGVEYRTMNLIVSSMSEAISNIRKTRVVEMVACLNAQESNQLNSLLPETATVN